MMTLINAFSLLAILISLSIALILPKVKLPIHVDIILFLLAIGAAALFINTVLGHDLHGHFRNAEVWFRFGFACLTVRFVYQSIRGAYK